MANSGLIIKITAEAAGFDKKIGEIKAASKSLEDQLGNVAKASGIAFAALAAAGGIALKAFGESEKASKELTLALQNQGIASKKLSDDYDKLARAIQKKTGVDDDAVKSGFAVLQGFIGQQEISAELADSLVNLAEKTGSVESAAEILGRGIQGNVKGLKQFGITIDDSLSKEERLAEITEKVTQKFGGLAEANGKGVGSIRGLTNAFGNFLESVGERLAPTFERVAVILTRFFQTLADNGPLLDFVVEAGKIVAILAGFVTIAATTAIAIVKIRDALLIAEAGMKILGLSTRALVGATGIGLILIIAAEIALNWNTIWPALTKIYNTFVDNIGALSGALFKLIQGVITFNPVAIKAGLDEAKAIITKGYREIAGEKAPEVGPVQDPKKLAAAQKAAAEELQLERTKRQGIQAERDLATLEATDASAQVIELKKQEIEILKKLEDEKFAGQRAALQENLEQTRALQAEALAVEKQQKTTFNEEILANDTAYQELDSTQKQLYLAKNQKALQDSQLAESQVQQRVILENQKRQIESNNKYLVEQQRFGTASATISQAINSSQIQGVQQTTGQLTALQNSRNSTLKSVGKAAAVADITIKTAQGAVTAFNGFLQAIPFPPVAIPLGIAAAGAVIAYGAEQVGTVLGAQDGGIVPGFNKGGDSVPSFLQPGELVVPRSSFSEVVDAVANQRANEAPQATAGTTGGAGGPQAVAVRVDFSGDGAEKFLTSRQREAQALGTYRGRGV